MQCESRKTYRLGLLFEASLENLAAKQKANTSRESSCAMSRRDLKRMMSEKPAMAWNTHQDNTIASHKEHLDTSFYQLRQRSYSSVVALSSTTHPNVGCRLWNAVRDIHHQNLLLHLAQNQVHMSIIRLMRFRVKARQTAIEMELTCRTPVNSRSPRSLTYTRSLNESRIRSKGSCTPELGASAIRVDGAARAGCFKLSQLQMRSIQVILLNTLSNIKYISL